MPRRNTPRQGNVLTGWRQIAEFLAQPIAIVQRWGKAGMPVNREGRRVYASPEELNRWLASESAGEPVHIASASTDLGSELKRGLTFVRKHSTTKQNARKQKKRAA